MKHFHYYPKINYSDNSAINIMVRGKIRDAILQKSALYYKHRVEDEIRPEHIAEKYYGNPNYTWAIFYANNMLHPIFDWPKSTQVFLKYIEQKYGSIENAQNTNREPHSYEYTDPITKIVYQIDQATYNEYRANVETTNFTQIISYYDYEMRLNENKRDILILDNAYVLQITNELKNLFK